MTGDKSDNNSPVARGGAVVQCVARATAAVSIGYCGGDTGRRVGGEFWGGSEIPRWGGARSGEQGQKGKKMTSNFNVISGYLSCLLFQRRRYLLTWNGKLVWATCHLHSSARSQVPVDR